MAATILLSTIAGALQRAAGQLLDIGQRRQDARLVALSARVNDAANDLLAYIDDGAGRDDRYDHEDERRQ